MRFEGKHSLFKNLAANASYKNITKYMAQRQQQALCSNMLTGNMFSSNAQHGPEVRETSHDIIHKIYQYQPGILLQEILQLKWFQFNGMKFKEHCFIASQPENDLPSFGKVKAIFYLQNKYVFLVQKFTTEGVDSKCCCQLLCIACHGCLAGYFLQ